MRHLLKILIIYMIFSSSTYANQKDAYIEDIEGIKDNLEKSQNIMTFERSGTGNDIPIPENKSDRPKRSYFSIIKYDIYSNLNGQKKVKTTVKNDSGGGIEIRPEHVKAYLSNGFYISPEKIEQNGYFSQGETKIVILHFYDMDEAILGLTTQPY